MPTSSFFNYRFADTELQTEFERWINNNVPELFSYFGQVNRSYTIGWIDARGVVGGDGRWRETLVQLSNMIQTPPSNNSGYKNIHLANIFLTMHLEANGNWQRLMSLVREFLQQLPAEDYRYNVVWYAEYLPQASTFDV